MIKRPVSYAENYYQASSLEACGMIAILAEWLRDNGVSDDTYEDVYNNTSSLRDGNRLDIMDNYVLDDFNELSYIYTDSVNVWGVAYNPELDTFTYEVLLS